MKIPNRFSGTDKNAAGKGIDTSNALFNRKWQQIVDLSNQRRWIEAEDRCKEALNIGVNSGLLQGHIHYFRGCALADARDFQGAADEFLRALNYETRYSGIYANLGFCLHRLGKLDEAIEAKGIAYKLCLDKSLPHNAPMEKMILEDLIKVIKEKDINVMGIKHDIETFLKRYNHHVAMLEEKLKKYEGYFPMTYRFLPPEREKFFEPMQFSMETMCTRSGNNTLLIKLEISLRTVAKWAHVYEVWPKLADQIIDAVLETQYVMAETQTMIEYSEFRRYESLILEDRKRRRSGLPEADIKWFADLVWFNSLYSDPMYLVESDNEDWIKLQIATGARALGAVGPVGAQKLQKEVLSIEEEFRGRISKGGFTSSWGFIL